MWSFLGVGKLQQAIYFIRKEYVINIYLYFFNHWKNARCANISNNNKCLSFLFEVLKKMFFFHFKSCFTVLLTMISVFIFCWDFEIESFFVDIFLIKRSKTWWKIASIKNQFKRVITFSISRTNFVNSKLLISLINGSFWFNNHIFLTKLNCIKLKINMLKFYSKIYLFLLVFLKKN